MKRKPFPYALAILTAIFVALAVFPSTPSIWIRVVAGLAAIFVGAVTVQNARAR